MDIEIYIGKKGELQNLLLELLENVDDNDENFNYLIELINKDKYQNNPEEFKQFLRLILNVSNNHHRTENFFTKIKKIILHFKDTIKQTLSNYEIFNIFESNNLILHFLLKENLITLDRTIVDYLKYIDFQKGTKKCQFFSPEIKKIDSKAIENDEIIDIKRQIGENDSYICSLIRQDSICEFVQFVTQSNLPIFSYKIEESIYETNNFLIDNKDTSLIEYAAFFGSLKIFEYLRFHGCDLEPSLWLYAIHGGNAELIHLIEESHVEPENKKYEECFKEAIKCHHNNIATYIQTNFLSDSKLTEGMIDSVINYQNYSFFPTGLDLNCCFYYLCSYKYHDLVNLFIKTNQESIEKEIRISKKKKFFLNDVFYFNFFFIYNDLDLRKAAEENKVDVVYYLLSKQDRIDDDCFKLCKKMKLIAIPDSINSIGSNCFYQCVSLEGVSIPSSVKTIGNDCFSGCSSLKEIFVPSSVTEIGSWSFNQCTSLINFSFSLFANLKSIEDYVFQNCSSLERMFIPPSVTSIGSWSFNCCSSLNKVFIPSSVTSINSYAFLGCKKLIEVAIPDSVINVGWNAFNLEVDKIRENYKKISIPPSLNAYKLMFKNTFI